MDKNKYFFHAIALKISSGFSILVMKIRIYFNCTQTNVSLFSRGGWAAIFSRKARQNAFRVVEGGFLENVWEILKNC